MEFFDSLPPSAPLIPIFCIGSINADQYKVNDNIKLYLGGSAANTAHFLSNLLDPTKYEVNLVGLLGTDPLGDQLFDILRKKKFSRQFIRRWKGLTSTTIITHNEFHERRIDRTHSVNENLLLYLQKPSLQSAIKDKICHLKAGREILTQYFKINPTLYSCDFSGFLSNLPTDQKEAQEIFSEWSQNTFQHGTIENIIGNFDEYANILYLLRLIKSPQEFLHYSREQQISLIKILMNLWHATTAVMKLGKNGAIGIFPNNIIISKPLNVKVIDTLGAGDAFNAAYIYGLLNKRSSYDCVELGCIIGSLNCTHYGGQEFIITSSELEKYLKEFQFHLKFGKK